MGDNEVLSIDIKTIKENPMKILRNIIADKGPSNQSYGFPSSHV